MQPFGVQLHPSRMLYLVGNSLHFFALIAILIFLKGWALGIICVSLLGAWWWFAHHAKRQKIKHIIIDAQERITLVYHQDEIAHEASAELIGMVLLNRHFFWIVLRDQQHKIWLAFLPDSADAESLRKLYVWLKWSRHKPDKIA